jgi:hypothetical protein
VNPIVIKGYGNNLTRKAKTDQKDTYAFALECVTAMPFEEENCKVRFGGTSAVIVSSYGMPSAQETERRSNLPILR